MPDKPWKRQEREIARLLGGHRLPNTGQGSPDVLASCYAVEVKTRKTLPAWLWQAVGQAQANAGGKAPVVVLVESRQGVKARRLVVLDWDTFTGQTASARPTGRPRLNIAVENVCDALQRHGSVAAAANALGCSRAYVYASLKGAGLTAAGRGGHCCKVKVPQRVTSLKPH